MTDAADRATRWVIRGLAAAGLLAAGVLFYDSIQLGGALPGCGGDSGCAAVLTSPWSKWLSIPVAAPAMVVYAVMLGAALHIGPSATPRRRRIAWMVLLIGAAAAAGAAVWFIAVQALLVQAFCKYCLAVHACGLLLAAVVAVRAPVSGRRAAGLMAVGLLPVAVLIGGQWLWPAASSRFERLTGGEGIGEADVLVIPLPGGGAAGLPPHATPVLGSPDAPVLVVSLYDYTCPHCRRMHGYLHEARARYSDQLGILAVPVPLDSDCNPVVEETQPSHEQACELATLALAVWRADPAKFEAFDAWLFAPETPPTAEAARAQAEAAVGAEALERALAEGWPQQQLASNVELYRLAGAGQIPQLRTTSGYLRGAPHDAAAVFEMLEAETALTPPAP